MSNLKQIRSMNTVANSWVDFKSFMDLYSPQRIPRYVSTGLRGMYLGKAPRLSDVAAHYGDANCRIWLSTMVEAIVRFAGLTGRFNTDLGVLSDMILCRFPTLKVTEVMHFVYLCQCGEYESFYGNPSGRALLGLMTRYVRADRERILASYRDDAARDIIGQPRAPLSGEEAKVVAEVIALMADPDFRQANGAWRYEPGADLLARAYFVDRTLATFPGDMTPSQRRRYLAATASHQ